MFELAPRLRHRPENRRTFFEKTVTLACPVCGALVAFEPRATGVACGTCRSPLHRQPDDEIPIGPASVVPFAISDEDALARIPAHDDSALLVGAGDEPRLRRVFVPCWRFAARIRASWEVTQYNRQTDEYDTKRGGVVTDYDDLVPCVPDEDGALSRWRPEIPPDLPVYEPSSLMGGEPLLPTVPLSTAWITVLARWEERITELACRNDSAWSGRQTDAPSLSWSEERGALVYLPIFVPATAADDTSRRWAIDGVTGQLVRARRVRKVPDDDAGPDTEKILGVAVLLAIGGVILALGLWFARRLWWY